jgi:hypothetical protein
MVHYELNFSIPSTGSHTTFIEFSPSGRFLAIGDHLYSSLHILDKCAGFHPILSKITPAKPTALVWETHETFYVGLNDGRFIHYQIDLGGEKLVEGVMNHLFRGAFPITAMALDAESKTLVLSVGPDVFVFRRICDTSAFYSSMYWSSELIFLKVVFASLQMYQAGSISQVTQGDQLPHFREPFVSPPTVLSSSRFAVKTSREPHDPMPKARPHFFLSTGRSCLSLMATHVCVPHSKR